MKGKQSGGILLVEPDVAFARNETALLQRLGFEVWSVHTGPEAVELARTLARIDLALISLDLRPELDGSQVAREILRIRSLPVVFQAASTSAGQAVELRKIPRYGYLVKNTLDDALQPVLEMALEMFKANQRTRDDALMFQRVADYSPDWEYWQRPDGTFWYVSPAFERITAYPTQKLLDNPDFLISIIHPDDRQVFMAHQEEIRAGHVEDPAIEFRVVTGSGEIRWIDQECQRIDSPDGIYQGVRASNRDITDHVLSLRALADSEEQFRSLFLTSQDGILFSAPDGTVFAANPAACRMLGWTETELVQMGRAGLVDEDSPEVQEALERGWQTHPFKGLLHFRRKDGTVLPVEISSAAYTSHGEIRSNVIFRDMTEHQQAQGEIHRLLGEKELLLKEVHHRIKNDMATVASLLAVQADSAPEKAEVEALRIASARVDTMLVIYKLLNQSDGYQNINLKEYLPELLGDIEEIWRGIVQNVTLDQEIDPIVISIKQSYPLGVIINEWVTNAYKHAFTDGNPGRIFVRVKRQESGAVEVHVGDNGVGLPAGFDHRNPNALGLKLVNMLVQQIGGQVKQGPDGNMASGEGAVHRGTEYSLVFKG